MMFFFKVKQLITCHSRIPCFEKEEKKGGCERKKSVLICLKAGKMVN